jgi:hypothetical protein
VRGGYLETARKKKFRARQRELQSQKEDRLEAEADAADEAQARAEHAAQSPPRVEMLDDDEDLHDPSQPLPRQVNNAPPLIHEHSDSDSDQETFIDVQVPDARNPGKMRTVRDKKSRCVRSLSRLTRSPPLTLLSRSRRYLRRQMRKEAASQRVHRIMEMDPNSMKELRESIRQKREAEKLARQQQQQSNKETEELVLEGGERAGGAEGLENMLPPPPPTRAAINALKTTEHLSTLLKSHKAVVSAVENVITSDTTNPDNVTDADLKLPPPPTPILYVRMCDRAHPQGG